MNDYEMIVLHQSRVNEMIREREQEALAQMAREGEKNKGGRLAALRQWMRRVRTDAGANSARARPCQESVTGV